MTIQYESPDGYLGILYGKKSMAIYDKKGHEVLHTGSRNIHTLDELKKYVDSFGEYHRRLLEATRSIYQWSDGGENV